jgi:hypothetical protein
LVDGSAIAVIEADVEEKAAAVVDDQPPALNVTPTPLKSMNILTNGVDHEKSTRTLTINQVAGSIRRWLRTSLKKRTLR